MIAFMDNDFLVLYKEIKTQELKTAGLEVLPHVNLF